MTRLRNRMSLIDLWCDLGYRYAVEVGTFKGEFAEIILRRSVVRRLVCVDPWAGEGMSEPYDGDAVYELVRRRLRSYGSRGKVARMTGLEWAAHKPHNSIDAVYIDALHDYESTLADIRAFLPLIKCGGIISGHDYTCVHEKRVSEAVDCMFPGSVLTTKCAPQSWYVRL